MKVNNPCIDKNTVYKLFQKLDNSGDIVSDDYIKFKYELRYIFNINEIPWFLNNFILHKANHYQLIIIYNTIRRHFPELDKI